MIFGASDYENIHWVGNLWMWERSYISANEISSGNINFSVSGSNIPHSVDVRPVDKLMGNNTKKQIPF